MKFKVGDVVCCNTKDFYGVTDYGIVCEVIEIYEKESNKSNDILVRIIGRKELWQVGSYYFSLHKENNLNLK